jgi:putative ATP-binding cassette transporter
MQFSFRNRDGAPVFTSGPWSLTLKRGETVFLVGGNGSGKSTVLRQIVGLYRPDNGRVDVDGVTVEGRAIAGLREQFSAIFGDFHLFDRLYGLEQVDPQKVNRLIDEMWLTGKVKFEDGRFTDLNLSTGQRKRLALIVALLEDRPIYAFDEWSAEQDAVFREEFYERILPALKAAGKTVVAVTHDERFWPLADRVVRFDLGRIDWERTGAELAQERRLLD